MRIIAGLRWALGIAFAAIVVSDLAECQPVSHYWQVTPDPGPQCRQGMAQLLTTGVASAVADVVLVLFPIPMVWRSRIALRRKLFLVLLFCFGFVTVGVTLYRVPAVVRDHGDQTRRSTWASVEILAATAVANIVALGSFLRDTGVKKKRYRHDGGYAYSSSAAAGADSSRRMTRGTMVSAAAEWEATLNQNQGVLRAKTTAQAWARDVDSAEDDSGASGHHGLDTEDQQQQQHQRYSKASSTARPASPAGSNASLIQSHQAYQTGSAAVVDPHPRPPSPVVQAPLRRGS